MDKILKTKEIIIRRSETNFDKACDAAAKMAYGLFDIDECGHSSIEGWNRSSCYIELKFISYEASFSMVGCLHRYTFEATAKAYIENEDIVE